MKNLIHSYLFIKSNKLFDLEKNASQLLFILYYAQPDKWGTLLARSPPRCIDISSMSVNLITN
jgi:hypothetical protein